MSAQVNLCSFFDGLKLPYPTDDAFEDSDVAVEIEVTSWQGAEPDVGIMRAGANGFKITSLAENPYVTLAMAEAWLATDAAEFWRDVAICDYLYSFEDF